MKVSQNHTKGFFKINPHLEKSFFDSDADGYAIYQLLVQPEGRYRFMSMSQLERHHLHPDPADYRFVYTGPYEGSLDAIYEKFNLDIPIDFFGHSLSVSDVILTRVSGRTNAYYVDSIGFAELPNWYGHIETRYKEEKRNYPQIYDRCNDPGRGDLSSYYDEACIRTIEKLKNWFEDDATVACIQDVYGDQRLAYVLASIVQGDAGSYSKTSQEWANQFDMLALHKTSLSPTVVEGIIAEARLRIDPIEIEALKDTLRIEEKQKEESVLTI